MLAQRLLLGRLLLINSVVSLLLNGRLLLFYLVRCSAVTPGYNIARRRLLLTAQVVDFIFAIKPLFATSSIVISVTEGALVRCRR